MKLTNITKIENLQNQIEVTLGSEGSKSSKMKILFGFGLEIKEIAVLMGTRYNFVYNVISNQVIVEGLEVSTEKPVSKRDLIIGLFTEGKSNKEIAVQLRTNYNYVYKIVKERKDEIAAEDLKGTEAK